MAPKTIPDAIQFMLANLDEKHFKSFCVQLRSRKEEPRVTRNRVEGKDYLDITDVLITTFTEDRAPEVAIGILETIGCGQDAKELAENIERIRQSAPKSSNTAGPSAGATSDNTMAGGKHFVDEYRLELIQRLKNINPMLDYLRELGIIHQEVYEEIRVPGSTSQEKMRMIYDGPLQAGDASKDAFYAWLEENESHMVADLKKKKKK